MCVYCVLYSNTHGLMIHVYIIMYIVYCMVCVYNYCVLYSNTHGLMISAKLIFFTTAVNFLNSRGFSSLTYRET